MSFKGSHSPSNLPFLWRYMAYFVGSSYNSLKQTTIHTKKGFQSFWQSVKIVRNIQFVFKPFSGAAYMTTSEDNRNNKHSGFNFSCICTAWRRWQLLTIRFASSYPSTARDITENRTIANFMNTPRVSQITIKCI